MRISIRFRAFTLVLLVGIVFACSSTCEDSEPAKANVLAQNEHKQLPAFVMSDAAGNTVNLSSFKDKKVFVNLWATWCPPCRAEIPSIEELVGKMDKRDVVFVMLSLDENFNIAKQFVNAKKMKAPIYYPAEKIPALLNTEGIPATFIFDEQGHLVKQVNGSDDYSSAQYVDLLKR